MLAADAESHANKELNLPAFARMPEEEALDLQQRAPKVPKECSIRLGSKQGS